jgi:hypothetical protein
MEYLICQPDANTKVVLPSDFLQELVEHVQSDF